MNEVPNKVVDRQSYKGIRLTEFHVEKLFDEFTYTIPLKLETRVTAIIAPNGAGKTLCLRLISGLFGQKWSVFTASTFKWVSYKFSDGTVVTIEPSTPGDETIKQRVSFRMTIKDAGGAQIDEWKHTLIDLRRGGSPIERYLPFVTRVGPNEWRHDHSGEVHNLQELVELYGNELPEPLREQYYGKVPEVFTAIISNVDCHLIETQRLLILPDEVEEPYYRRGRRPPSTLAIAKKAQALKEIISKDINNYASLSQSLDRSFPKRVITHPTLLPSDDLKVRLQELDRRRSELMEAGILDTEADDPVALPEGELEAAIARVLSVYADDNQQKLSSLSSLLAKIKLFKALIDQRFLTKDVRITKQNGIEVTYKDRNVPIEGLSSGEQHQLVLFFELLFEINENALILIDEPELSLHVAWQKKFIGDLMQIIELNKFDVILATHSPQLISRWNSLVVELGDVYEGAGEEVEENGGK